MTYTADQTDTGDVLVPTSDDANNPGPQFRDLYGHDPIGALLTPPPVGWADDPQVDMLTGVADPVLSQPPGRALHRQTNPVIVREPAPEKWYAQQWALSDLAVIILAPEMLGRRSATVSNDGPDSVWVTHDQGQRQGCKIASGGSRTFRTEGPLFIYTNMASTGATGDLEVTYDP